MELFSEIYSCYFTAIRKLLEASQKKSLTNDEAAAILNASAFAESSFFIMPYLQSGEWNLLNRIEAGILKTPMTALQKSWLKALLSDRRIRLFLDDPEEINSALGGVSPLYENNDFHYFDAAADGDSYDDEQYKKNFRIVLSAIKNKTEIKIEYDSGKAKRFNGRYIPLKLNYSRRDDKLRLIATHVMPKRMGKAILNLSRIKSVTALQGASCRDTEKNITSVCKEPIVLQILPGRNALERYMLQFASMEKHTEYHEETGSYICRIFYDSRDETELLIKILSFGPMVKVLGPESFLGQIRERIEKQAAMNKKAVQ